MNHMTALECNSELQNKFIDELKKRGEKYALMWRMGVESGLRISDLLTLTLEDILQYPLEINEKKTGKKRTLYFSDSLFHDLCQYRDNNNLTLSDYIFQSSRQRESAPEYKVHMTRQQAHRVIMATARKLNLKNVGTHSMRKTFASNYFASTGDIKGLQALLNHKNLETTLLYIVNIYGSDKKIKILDEA